MGAAQKKLREIDKLEKEAADGKTLQPNQMTKVGKRGEVEDQLHCLQASLRQEQGCVGVRCWDIVLLREWHPYIFVSILHFTPPTDVFGIIFSTTSFLQLFRMLRPPPTRKTLLRAWQFRHAISGQLYAMRHQPFDAHDDEPELCQTRLHMKIYRSGKHYSHVDVGNR